MLLDPVVKFSVFNLLTYQKHMMQEVQNLSHDVN